MKIVIFFISMLLPSLVLGSELDFKLQKIIEIYGLKGFQCSDKQPHNPRLTKLGDELFNSQLLSGGNDTSCATCHISELSRTDGLQISIGVGGKGESFERLENGKGTLVPRNSFTFVGRGHADYNTYFWDGRVQNRNNETTSIIGDISDEHFDSSLAIAAVVPLLARDEFLGLLENQAENRLLTVDDEYYESRYDLASSLLNDRLNSSKGAEWDALRNSFLSAGLNPSEVKLSDIGNAISAFLINEENCFQSHWSKYIMGAREALSDSEKRGAYLFYGKGRCSACHSGDLLTDFEFHSIAVPQGQFGFSMDGQDLGRAEISLRAEDRYKFRTPSLLKVSDTSPYGHNGTFSTLEDVVLFHTNPVIYFQKNKFSEKELLNYGRVLSSRSETLSYIGLFSEQELSDLISFLKVL